MLTCRLHYKSPNWTISVLYTKALLQTLASFWVPGFTVNSTEPSMVLGVGNHLEQQLMVFPLSHKQIRFFPVEGCVVVKIKVMNKSP
jgi:hypothetical protein